MAHDSQDFSSPQEAIEGYLEALLQDVADYDEPEVSDSASASQEPEGPMSSVGIEVEQETSVTTADEQGTRVFAPPSAREYAREAAAQIRQRQQSVQSESPKVEVAYQETPTVVMPELKVAQPETEVKTETQVKEEIKVQPEPKISEPEIDLVEPEAALVEPVADLSAEIDLNTSVVDQVDATPEVKENEGWSNGRPDWAQGRFECLLFVVKGLKLAVPLAELGGIHKLEKEPTPLFGQPGWFLGIVRTNNMNVGLVDTAQWVMSEYIKDDHKPDSRFAIRIHNSDWGLACHEVAEAISLDPSEVKWRTSLGRRPWLAGTVVDHMCALIDVAAFARLLDSDKVPVDLQALMSDEE